MRRYVARTAHAKPCDLCDSPILPGDKVEPWCWTNAEWEKKGDKKGGICRTHKTCFAIGEREGLMEETLRTFEDADTERWDESGEDGSIPDAQYKLTIEADKALAAARMWVA